MWPIIGFSQFRGDLAIQGVG